MSSRRGSASGGAKIHVGRILLAVLVVFGLPTFFFMGGWTKLTSGLSRVQMPQVPLPSLPLPKIGDGQGNPAPNQGNLRKVQIGVVQFPSYAGAIGATNFASKYGVTIEVVELDDQSETKQCEWIRANNDRILFTTLNSARACEGTRVPMVIDQSKGADAIVVKPNVRILNDIFVGKVRGIGECSVSEYNFKNLAWAFGQQKVNWSSSTSSEPAKVVDEWVNDRDAVALSIWQPHADTAAKRVGGRIILSSESWAGLLDVAVIKANPDVNPGIQGALSAYFEFLKVQSERPREAWDILSQWAQKNPKHAAVVQVADYKDSEEFVADLKLVAQASLNDNIQLFLADTAMLRQRIGETDKVNAALPCTDSTGKTRSLPALGKPEDLLDGRYIDAIRSVAAVQTNAKGVNPNIVLSVNVPFRGGLTDAARTLIGQLPIAPIQFKPNSTDFVDEATESAKLEQTYVPIMRLTDNTVLELLGGYAFPTDCGECTDANGRALALARVERIQRVLVSPDPRFGIPANRVRLAKDTSGNTAIREPQNRVPEALNPDAVASDRRVEGSLFTLGGQ